jgi:hypothetical protein
VKEKFIPKIFCQLSLDALLPKDNFYRKLRSELRLNFLYKATRNYYGKEGRASIDPVGFFKAPKGLYFITVQVGDLRYQAKIIRK